MSVVTRTVLLGCISYQMHCIKRSIYLSKLLKIRNSYVDAVWDYMHMARGGRKLHNFFLLISRNFSKTKSARYKVKVKFNLEQATKAQRGSTGVTLLFL
jgi:hypothetical protein